MANGFFKVQLRGSFKASSWWCDCRGFPSNLKRLFCFVLIFGGGKGEGIGVNRNEKTFKNQIKKQTCKLKEAEDGDG